ncbi:WecB/TagA/CpsF family glycosyltransferase [Microbacterium sediminicola]|uniref:WecB/TagA/CpsF family glycosyltransferase n=1 Tax=Microbacterium sediminicola TaxID=415210 RepID=A0ABP4TF36_9MICO
MSARPLVTQNATFQISPFDEEQVVAALLDRTPPLDAGRPHLIVTPNMNHLARLQASAPLGAAYDRADMILADGWPVVRLANSLGAQITGRATGSGIVRRLADTPGEGRTIFLVGGSTPQATDTAAARFRSNGWLVETEHAPIGWLDDTANIDELAGRIAASQASIVLLGVGSPKQEILGATLLDAPGVTATMLGIGASIDFLAGHTRRAPEWMQRLGIEWLHRIITDPARLLRRYAGDVVPFVRVARQSRRFRPSPPEGATLS